MSTTSSSYSVPVSWIDDDFWRSGAGATKPDGITDEIDAISHSGDVGIGISDPSTLTARLDVNGAQVLRPVTIANLATSTTVGTAAATVDIASMLVLNQTTANTALTLPNPTNAQGGRLLFVSHNGTATGVTVAGKTISPGETLTFVWDGNSWNGSAASIPNDFWRSNTGATLPDGTTDDSENVSRAGNVGIGIANPSTVAARLDVQGAQILRPVTLANFAANAVIGAASTTVNIASTIEIPQTTAGITLTLPNPTNTQEGRLLIVANTGTQSVTVAGVVLRPSFGAGYYWNGSAWNSFADAQTTGWLITGNSGTTNTAHNDGGGQANNFMGTLDNQSLSLYTNASAANGKSDLKLYTSVPTGGAITPSSDIFHVRRGGQAGVTYSQSMSIALGKWLGDINGRTRVDFRLGNGVTQTPDRTNLSLFSSGGVGITGNGSAADWTWQASGGIGRGNGGALLSLMGANASNNLGPHIGAWTTTDTFPNYYQLNWMHDNVAMNFDGYHAGVWLAAHTTRPYSIYKNSDRLNFYGQAALPTAPGTSWSQDLMMAMRYAGATLAGGELWFNNVIKNRRIVLFDVNAASDHQYYGFGINGGTLRYQVDSAAANHIFYAGSSATTSTELMRIQGNGRVAIGISAPTARLHVSGPNANAGGSPLFRVSDTNIAASNLAIDNGAAANAYRIVATGTALEIQSGGNSNQLVLVANGAVGIGTNAPTAGAGRLSVATNANKPGGGAWAVFSDQRIKKDIKPFTAGLKQLLALNPIEFKYNGKAGSIDDGNIYYSLIAQEVKEVLPEFVESMPIADDVYEAMNKKDQKLFADKTVLSLKEGLTNFEAVLIRAVQELAEQNKQLSERIAALEGKQ